MRSPTARPDGAALTPLRGRTAFAAVTGAGLAAALTLAVVDPDRPGHYPACPFLFVTGELCPGCGSLRAAHDLLHLDLCGALARNPLAVALLPLLVVAWVRWGLLLTGRRAPRSTPVPTALVWGLLGVVLGYWVLRNVPGWTWLSPA